MAGKTEPSDYDAVVNKVQNEILRPGITQPEVIDYYKTWANTYDQDLAKIEYNPPRCGATELAAVLTDNYGARIMDCAAGTGLVGEELAKLGYKNLDAIDASQEMLDIAKDKKVYKNLICDFLGPNKLDIADDTYDAIVSVGSFCEGHLKGDCFEEFIRIVKPGGHIVIAMSEEQLTKVDAFINKLEAQMQALHDDKHWEWVTRKIYPRYYNDVNGLVFKFVVK